MNVIAKRGEFLLVDVGEGLGHVIDQTTNYVGPDMKLAAILAKGYWEDYKLDTIEKQLPIDDPSKENLLRIRTQIFYDQTDALAEQLYNGDISIGQWEETMKKYIREIHSSSAAIGKGGWDLMTSEDWGRIGPEVKKQYRWLHNFAETISEKRDTISLQAIKARAHLYGNAAGHTAAMQQAGRIVTEKLPWLPGDGSTLCMINCHCRWEISVIDISNGVKHCQAIWRLGEADHCETCKQRNGYVHLFQVHESVDVPSVVGGF